MKRLQVGFIGAGAVAELHYLAITACPYGELAAICDADPSVLLKRKQEWNVLCCDSMEQLLGRPDIDAVFVLTPIECHFEHVKAALNAGKHVLVEKPVSDDLSNIREMRKLAEAKNLVCMPAHNYIYHPDLLRMKDHAEKGLFGSVAVSWVLFHIHHDEEQVARFPGIIGQVGTHLLYTHRYLFGAPAGVTARCSNFRYPHLPNEDQVMIVLHMRDGSFGNLFATFAVSDQTSNPWTFVVKALGTCGGGQMSWRDSVFERRLGTLSQSYGKYEDTFRNEVDFFLGECIQKGVSPLSTLEDAEAVQLLLQEVLRQCKTE